MRYRRKRGSDGDDQPAPVQGACQSHCIRWFIRRDMPDVLDIEQHLAAEGNPECWDEEDYLVCLRQRNCRGLIAERDDADDRPVGCVLYAFEKTHLHVLRLAVHPDFRGQRCATSIVEKLKSKISQQRRTHIVATVRESALSMLLFLKSQRFVAEDLVRGHYDAEGDTGEDMVRMVWRIGGKDEIGAAVDRLLMEL